MSAAVDQFCDKLRDQLNAIEGRFAAFTADMQSLSEKAEASVRGKLDEARAKVEAQKGKIEKTRDNLKAMAQQKVAETKEAINVWKANHETRKLKARADRAEDYAADAIIYAQAAIDRAEEAILEAVVARMDADAVK
jgi:NTP pyrophosphatase (non-canonical NTP hydrolase)